MATLRELVVKISANSTSFQTEIARASRMGADYYKTMENGGRKAAAASRESERALKSISSQLNSVRSAAGGLAGAFAGAFATTQLIHYADTWTQLNSRLRLASTSAIDFANNQRLLMDISQRTGTSLEANTNMFSRMAKAMQQLGYSGADTAKVTELVATSLRLSGAGAGEAASVITQFGQAMASGVLRGDEFNSIMENGGRFAQALADGLHVSVGQLRAMAQAGQLTTDKIMPALLGQLGKVREEGVNMGSTVSASVQRVENAFLAWVGTSNDAVGASSALASSMDFLAKNMGTIANVAGVLVGVGLMRYFGDMVKGAGSAALSIFETQKAEVALAAAQVEGSKVAVARARAAVFRAASALEAARGTEGQALAEANLAKAQTAATAATAARAAAMTRLNGITSVASRLGSGLLSVVGGIPGIIMGVGAAIMYAYERQKEATAQNMAYADSLADVVKNAKELTQVQLAGEMAKADLSINAQKDNLQDLVKAQEEARKKAETLAAQAKAVGQSFNNEGLLKKAADAQREYAIASAETEAAQRKLSSTESQRAQLAGTMADMQASVNAGIDSYMAKLDGAVTKNIAMQTAMAVTMQFMDQLAAKGGQAGATGASTVTAAQQKALDDSKKQLARAGLKGVALARVTGADAAAAAGFKEGDAGWKTIVDNAIEAAKRTEAATTATKAHTAAQKEENKTAREAKEHAKRYNDEIAKLNVEVEEARLRATKGAKAAQDYAMAHDASAKMTAKEAAAISKLVTEREKYNALAEANSRNEEARTGLNVTRATRGMGSKEADEYREIAQAQQEYNKAAIQSPELAKKLAEQLDIIHDKYAEMRESNADWISGMQSGLKDWVDSASNYSAQAADAVKNGMDGLVNNVADMLEGNKASWKDWATSVLGSIEKILLNAALVQGIKALGSSMSGAGGMMGAIGSGLSSMFSAKGNVFASGIHGYSNQIVSRPTMFAFARGAGIMGEAGPEAVMPLTRGANGRLGVAASGSGGAAININTTVNVNGNSSNSQSSGSNDAVGRAYEAVINKNIQDGIRRELKPGGMIWAAQQKH